MITPTPEACARFEAQLPDYLEGTLPPAEQAEAARHAAGCAACGPLAADLRAITLAAAKLPSLRPERDLWSGIAARIEPTVVPLAERLADRRPGAVAGAPPAAARVTHVAVPRRWLAAAAAALVAVSAGVSWQLATRLNGGTGPVASVDTVRAQPVPVDTPTTIAPSAPRMVAQAPQSARPPRGPSSDGPRPIVPTRPPELVATTVAAAEVTYDAEITELRRIVGDRRTELDSSTVAVLERNLRVIDAAIAESKRALARDPASRFLGEQVTRAYDRKVQLLRTAALLPSRI